MDLALRVCKAAPLAVWASRKIVLAAATESDETLINMTNKEFGVWGGVYLNLGRVDKSANSHKTDEVWQALEDIHEKRLIR
jgi:hypothetical protein